MSKEIFLREEIEPIAQKEFCRNLKSWFGVHDIYLLIAQIEFSENSALPTSQTCQTFLLF